MQFKEFVEVSKDNLDKLSSGVFVTEEADPEKAIPALIEAVMSGKAIAAIWLHDYWAKERALFKQLQKDGDIDVLYLQHIAGGQDLTAKFNCAADLRHQKLINRMKRRQKTLEKIVLRHLAPEFREYLIKGSKDKGFFDVNAKEQFHVDQSIYFSLSFIGAIIGPGTWFLSQEDTAYYKGYFESTEFDKGEMTRAYCSNPNPVLYAVPEGAILIMTSGDQAPNGGKSVLHSTPFAIKIGDREFKEGQKRVFERFTFSSPAYKKALKQETH